MINKTHIEELIKNNFTKEGIFIVDINISDTNNITILVDKNEGISINDCMNISRVIESNLNRNETDFSLDVSSPGLTSPFKVIEQYKKNIGNTIEILKNDGIKLTGKLLKVANTEIEIQEQKKINIAGKKKKKIVTTNTTINLNEVKSAKAVIDFQKNK